jgi:hypothetical protein
MTKSEDFLPKNLEDAEKLADDIGSFVGKSDVGVLLAAISIFMAEVIDQTVNEESQPQLIMLLVEFIFTRLGFNITTSEANEFSLADILSSETRH